jgi:hypothetical protein
MTSKKDSYRSQRDNDDDDDSRPRPFFMSHSSKRSSRDYDNQRPGFSMWHKSSSSNDERRSRYPWSQNGRHGSFSKWHKESNDRRSGFPFNKYDEDDQRFPFSMWRHNADDRLSSSMFGSRSSSYGHHEMRFPYSHERDRFSHMSQYRPMFDRSFGPQQMSGPSPMFLQMMQQRAPMPMPMPMPMSQGFIPRTPPPSLDLGAVIKALIARSAAQTETNEPTTPSVEIAFKGPVNVPSPEIAAPRENNRN